MASDEEVERALQAKLERLQSLADELKARDVPCLTIQQTREVAQIHSEMEAVKSAPLSEFCSKCGTHNISVVVGAGIYSYRCEHCGHLWIAEVVSPAHVLRNWDPPPKEPDEEIRYSVSRDPITGEPIYRRDVPSPAIQQTREVTLRRRVAELENQLNSANAQVLDFKQQVERYADELSKARRRISVLAWRLDSRGRVNDD